MRSPVTAARPRGRNAVLGLAASLLLMVGGVCGVGPTSLSRLAVTARQPVPEDVRVQAAVPMVAEAADPVRRVVRVAFGAMRHRVTRSFMSLRRLASVLDRLTVERGPPRRGPPAPVLS